GVDARQVGRELGVRYLLEGSVRRSGARLRISMQLIECSTGHHLWVKRFDRELINVFEVQDEVARDVASTLAVKLRAGVRKYDGTSGLECYDTFLRARGHSGYNNGHNLGSIKPRTTGAPSNIREPLSDQMSQPFHAISV